MISDWDRRCIANDPVEQATLEWLEHQEYPELRYEPNGNKTFPDFAHSRHVVVECTRLQKTIRDCSGSSLNATACEPSLLQSAQNTIEQFKRGDGTPSVFASVRVSRHCDKSELRRSLKRVIGEYHSQHEGSVTTETRENDLVKVRFQAGSRDYGSRYRLGGFLMPHMSGWVIPELLEQTEDAVARKTPKARNLSAPGRRFWLAVGGSLATGLSDSSFVQLKSSFRLEPPWTRLIFLNLADPKRSRVIDASIGATSEY